MSGIVGNPFLDDDELKISVPIDPDDEMAGDHDDSPHVFNPFADDGGTASGDHDDSNGEELHVLSPDELFNDDEDDHADSSNDDEDDHADSSSDVDEDENDTVDGDAEPDDVGIKIINPAGVPDVVGDSIDSDAGSTDDVDDDEVHDELRIVEPVDDDDGEDRNHDSIHVDPISVDDSRLSGSDDGGQADDGVVDPIVGDDHIVDHDDAMLGDDRTNVDGDHDGSDSDDEAVEPDDDRDGSIADDASESDFDDSGHATIGVDAGDDDRSSDGDGGSDSTISVGDSSSGDDGSSSVEGDPVDGALEDDAAGGSTDDGNDDDTIVGDGSGDGLPEDDDSTGDDVVDSVVGGADDDDSSGGDVLDDWDDPDSGGEDDSFPVGGEDEFPLDDGRDSGDAVDRRDGESGGWVDEEPDEYALPDPGESYPDLSDGDPLLNDLLGDDVIEAIDHERGASPKDGGPHLTSDDGGHDDDDSGGRHHEAVLADVVGDGGALGDEATERYDSEIRPAAVERRARVGRRVRSGGDLADGVRIGSAKAVERGSVRLRAHKAIDDPELARRLTIREWRQGRHVRFTKRDVRAMDYLTRWSYATTAQVARAGGWRDRKGDRLTRRFETWDDQGWAHENREFAGPVLWAPTDDGAELGRHGWLGGVSFRRMNPMSQSHSLGLSSLASWLLCGWDDAPDVMHLNGDWKTLMGELRDGKSFIVSEREIRSCYSKIRSSMRGLLPAGYRCALLGGVDPKTGETIDGRFKEFHDKVDSGEVGLESSPELASCSLDSEGVEQWLWVVWGDWVWNVDPSTGDASYVPVEDRYDVVQNKPMVDKTLGDRFVMLDHVPDLVVARRRRGDGSSRSLAVELELKTKDQLSYDRTMASYGSRLGKLLYDKVVWMVPDSTVALAVLRSAVKLGMTRGEDFEIIPFATSERRNSYWTGADMVPAVWGRDNRVIPMIDPDSVLLS